jgi:general secretion pathway protein G
MVLVGALAVIGGFLAINAAIRIREFKRDVEFERTNVTPLFVRLTMQTPLNQYRADMGDFPSTTEGLQALLTPPLGKERTWRGPYLDLNPPDKMPLDAWGQPYNYRYPGTHNKSGYDLFSSGPDKIPGTTDDIGNW